MTEQQSVEKALEYAKNLARGEWEDNRTSFESLDAEVTETTTRPDGGENYHIMVSALIVDNFDHDLSSEQMELVVYFDQNGRAHFSDMGGTRLREDDV